MHLPTGKRVLVPAIFDPITGGHRVRASVHSDVVPLLDKASESTSIPHKSNPLACFISALLCGLCGVSKDEPMPKFNPDESSPVRRALNFEEDAAADNDVDEEKQAKRLAVPAATLDGLRSNLGKLALHDIPDFLTDLEGAVSPADTDAFVLMTDPEWRTHMNSARAIRVNARIATAVDGALDENADTVKHLKSILRKANRSDRPGNVPVLSSSAARDATVCTSEVDEVSRLNSL
jgi:hypothetical protein